MIYAAGVLAEIQETEGLFSIRSILHLIPGFEPHPVSACLSRSGPFPRGPTVQCLRLNTFSEWSPVLWHPGGAEGRKQQRQQL